MTPKNCPIREDAGEVGAAAAAMLLRHSRTMFSAISDANSGRGGAAETAAKYAKAIRFLGAVPPTGNRAGGVTIAFRTKKNLELDGALDGMDAPEAHVALSRNEVTGEVAYYTREMISAAIDPDYFRLLAARRQGRASPSQERRLLESQSLLGALRGDLRYVDDLRARAAAAAGETRGRIIAKMGELG